MAETLLFRTATKSTYHHADENHRAACNKRIALNKLGGITRAEVEGIVEGTPWTVGTVCPKCG